MPNVSTATPIETETLANGYSPTVGRGAVTKAGSRRPSICPRDQCEIEARAPLGAGRRRHDRAADGSNTVVGHNRMRLDVIKLTRLNVLLIARMSRCWVKSGRMSVSKLVRPVIAPRRIFITPFFVRLAMEKRRQSLGERLRLFFRDSNPRSFTLVVERRQSRSGAVVFKARAEPCRFRPVRRPRAPRGRR
jgi:hypothetical protein